MSGSSCLLAASLFSASSPSSSGMSNICPSGPAIYAQVLALSLGLAVLSFYLGMIAVSLPAGRMRRFKSFGYVMMMDGAAYIVFMTIINSIWVLISIALSVLKPGISTANPWAAVEALYAGYFRMLDPNGPYRLMLTQIYSAVTTYLEAYAWVPVTGAAQVRMQWSFINPALLALNVAYMVTTTLYLLGAFVRCAWLSLVAFGALIYGLPARIGRRLGAALIATMLVLYVGLPFMPNFVGTPDTPGLLKLPSTALSANRTQFYLNDSARLLFEAGLANATYRTYLQPNVWFRLFPEGGYSGNYLIELTNGTLTWKLWTDIGGNRTHRLPPGNYTIKSIRYLDQPVRFREEGKHFSVSALGNVTVPVHLYVYGLRAAYEGREVPGFVDTYASQVSLLSVFRNETSGVNTTFTVLLENPQHSPLANITQASAPRPSQTYVTVYAVGHTPSSDRGTSASLTSNVAGAMYASWSGGSASASFGGSMQVPVGVDVTFTQSLGDQNYAFANKWDAWGVGWQDGPAAIYNFGDGGPWYVIAFYDPSGPGFDFSVANSGPMTVEQGQSGVNTITVALVSGNAQTVTLSASGLPSGVSATFNPSSGSPYFTSTLTINTSTSAPAGSYTITVTGVGGGLTRSTDFTLTIIRVVTVYVYSADKAQYDSGLYPWGGGTDLNAVIWNSKQGSAVATPYSFRVPEDTLVQFTVPSNPSCYGFVEWDDFGIGRSSSSTLVVDVGSSDRTIVALFQKQDFAIWVEPPSGIVGVSQTTTATVHVDSVVGNPTVYLSTNQNWAGVSPSIGVAPFDATLIMVGPSTFGSYTVRVTGTCGATSRSADFILVVGGTFVVYYDDKADFQFYLDGAYYQNVAKWSGGGVTRYTLLIPSGSHTLLIQTTNVNLPGVLPTWPPKGPKLQDEDPVLGQQILLFQGLAQRGVSSLGELADYAGEVALEMVLAPLLYVLLLLLFAAGLARALGGGGGLPIPGMG